MNEMKTLTLNGKTYDSFPDQKTWAELEKKQPKGNYVKTVNGVEPNGSGNVVLKSVLAGKTVAVLGDSISSVDYTLPNYWQKIAEKTGCTFVNYGVSASRIASSVHPLNIASFVERYVNMTTEADAVIIMGGTNDVGNSQLGQWASTDPATLYGALNTLLPQLCVRYPGKPIVFFAPMRMMNETVDAVPPTYADLAQKSEAETLNMPYVRLAIMAKCEQYGIPYVPTDKLSGINGNDTEGVYYRNKDAGQKDVLHPSEYGVVRLANIVQAELEKRFVHNVGDPSDGEDSGGTGDGEDTGGTGEGDDTGETVPALELTLANDSITSDATDEKNRSNIDGTTVLVPGYYAANGSFGELDKMHITNFIKVDGYTRVEYKTYMGPNYYILTFHDASGNLLKDDSVLVPSDATIGFWEDTVEIPAAAVYVRLAGYHTTAYNNGYMKLCS